MLNTLPRVAVKMFFKSRRLRYTYLVVFSLLSYMPYSGVMGSEKKPPELSVKVIPSPDQTQHKAFRRMLVGPGVQEPAAYPGYTGFVGWESIVRTQTGDMLMTFSSGYWHGSPPTPLADRMRTQLEKYQIPWVDAPRGGRAHIMRSKDGGLTWSDPKVLIDTPGDDRAPAAVQLSNGTLMASFFVWPPKRVGIIRSFDDGRTWEQEPHYLQSPFKWTATDGPPVELPDGSVVVVTYAGFKGEDKKAVQGIFKTKDGGDTWRHIATLDAPFNLDEPAIAALPDGRLITICRREGAVAWSSDLGNTWTKPQPLPFKMYDPWLLVLKNGTLICVHGSYNKEMPGVRAILSPDGGATWMAAGSDYGFSIDPSVYGYSRGIQLDDGSIFMVYIYTGGHTVDQIERQAIFAIRFKVLDGCQGVELLPAPGSKADHGAISSD